MTHPLHDHLIRVRGAHHRAYADAAEQAAAAAAELDNERATARLVDTEATDVAQDRRTPDGRGT